MRPHKLELVAIGSYAGQVVVDFDQLAPHGLFHIHGPTGAGKSSLLDAMCFALYGQLPPPRQTEGLRSHHAEPAVEASVAFEFSAQGDDWRVVRKPKQRRAKKIGSGTTEQHPTVNLLKRQRLEWAAVANGPSEVDPIIRGLIGLNAEQFMQVVVLPQGAFQKALRADDKERGALLTTLFGTERFVRYSERLKERADALKRDLDLQSARARGMVVQAASRSKAIDLDVNWPDTPMLDDDELSRMKRAAALAAAASSESAREVAELAAVKAKAEADCRTVNVRADRHRRRASAEAKLAALADRDQLIAEVEHELRQAESVAPLLPLLDAVASARHAHEAALQTRVTHQRDLSSRLDALPSAASDLRSALETLVDGVVEPRAVEVAQRLGRELSGEVRVVLSQASEAARSRADAAEHEAAVTEVTKAIEAAKAEVARWNELVDKLKAEQAEAAERVRNIEALSEEATRLQVQVAAADELAVVRERLLSQREATLAAERAANEAVAAHLALLHRRLDGMAAELAGRLRDGDPCMVCGSADHPAPAAAGPDAVDDAAVKRAATAAESAQDVVRERRAAFESTQAQAETLSASAGPAADNVEDVRTALESAVEACCAADASVARLDDLQQELADAVAAVELAARAVAEHESEVVRLGAAAAQSTARAAALEAAVAEVLGRDVDALETKELLDAVLALLDRLTRAALEEAAAHDRLEHERATLDSRMSVTGVDSVEAVRLLARTEQERATLSTCISEHRHAVAAARAVLAEPDMDDVAEAEELAAVEAAAKQAGAAYDAAVGRQARIHTEATELERLAATYASEYNAIAPLRLEEERVRQLHELCHGVRTNEKRMSLERYVLAAYLEEVAAAAGQRLRKMSFGRYDLRHSDAKTKGGGASGLSLMVSDAYTGVEREVSTLSGGETFLASLALALGLADVVQHHAGGVHIEALFIDEGFGSLDEDTLELAMAELDRLREGGRMVGVISHVPALRSRIPAGIEVTAGQRGSTLKLVGVADAVPA